MKGLQTETMSIGTPKLTKFIPDFVPVKYYYFQNDVVVKQTFVHLIQLHIHI